MKRGESREEEKLAPALLSLPCSAPQPLLLPSLLLGCISLCPGSPPPQAVCPLGPSPDAFCRGISHRPS